MNNEQVAKEFEQKIQLFKKYLIEEFERRVKDKTPVRSGAARDGYYVEDTGDGFELKNHMDYVQYLELGTEHMRPFAMVQTTMMEEDEIIRIAKEKAGL